MPKKSKLYGWSCSECIPESSSADEDYLVDDSNDRKRKRRVAASKARFLSIVDAAGHLSGSDDFETPAKIPRQKKKSDEVEVVAVVPGIKPEVRQEANFDNDKVLELYKLFFFRY